MKKEEDFISTLLQETYGHVSDQSDSRDQVPLSDYFARRTTSESGESSLYVQVFSDFVRFNMGLSHLDIPFGIGLMEKFFFSESSEPKLFPISDFVLIGAFSAHFEKRVSWICFDSSASSALFLSRKEALDFSKKADEIKKAA